MRINSSRAACPKYVRYSSASLSGSGGTFLGSFGYNCAAISRAKSLHSGASGVSAAERSAVLAEAGPDKNGSPPRRSLMPEGAGELLQGGIVGKLLNLQGRLAPHGNAQLSNSYPLHLVRGHFAPSAVAQLRGACAGVVRHPRSHLQYAVACWSIMFASMPAIAGGYGARRWRCGDHTAQRVGQWLMLFVLSWGRRPAQGKREPPD